MTYDPVKSLNKAMRSLARWLDDWEALPESERQRIQAENAERNRVAQIDQLCGAPVVNAKTPVADPDAELRLEVCEALQAEGKAPHVAANLTNTTAKLLTQAKRLQLI